MVLRFIRTDIFLEGEGRHSCICKHLDFRLEDIQSATIVHLIRQLELPFKATAVVTYSFWKEGYGDQKLEMMMRDYLKVFRDIMLDQRWENDFDFVFRANF